ncbi:MAG: (Fe-S)-binding protein [Candidatus Delongbacteria bacterium]
MPKNDFIIKELTEKCTNCGNCRIICPVFKEKGEEAFSARGRINLIRGLVKKELPNNQKIRGHIFTCLDCRQCIDYCPADVDYSNIMSLVKRDLKSRSRFLSLKDMLTSGLFSAYDHSFYFKALRFLKNLITVFGRIKPLKKYFSAVLSYLNIPEYSDIPEKNFFRIKKRHELKKYSGIRTAVFTGCGGKYLYPETADRFVKILRNSGIEAVIPKEQVCCGNPLLYSGLSKNISQNRSVNMKAFNSLVEISFVTSLCSGATGVLGSYGKEHNEGRLRFKVRDHIEVLTEYLKSVEPEYSKRIIFHSCPKCKNQKSSNEFIKNLYIKSGKTPPVTFDYCGCTELLDRSNLEARSIITGAFCGKNNIENYDIIACSSFECIEYLNYYFSANKMKIRAVHFIEAVKT